MGVFVGLFIIAACSVLLGFVLGRSYQSHEYQKKLMDLQDLRRHIRESNERAS